MSVKETIESIVSAERFSMRNLHTEVWHEIENQQTIKSNIFYVKNHLVKKYYRSLAYSILRHTFLIELVKVPKIDSTKVRVRWDKRLQDDQRRCSFDECMEIANDLIRTLANQWIDDPKKLETLKLFFDNSILPYEAPIDYLSRPELNNLSTRIHRLRNIGWISDEIMLRTLKLRRFLTEDTSNLDEKIFKKVLNDKVKIKTYLTDRVLTGEHKTNREKRWEVHPHSVHFAGRKTCMEIEYTLLTELCSFNDFPDSFLERLKQENIISNDLETFCCPITLEHLSFENFKNELVNPIHGKSNFQVGHLNPLKFDNSDLEIYGHTAKNISWISANGNRIQGSMSLNDVRKMLKRIAQRYESRGWV